MVYWRCGDAVAGCAALDRLKRWALWRLVHGQSVVLLLAVLLVAVLDVSRFQR